MVTFRVSQILTKDGSQYKWEVVDKNNEDKITMITLKGTYTIDYPQPTCFYDNTTKCKTRGKIEEYTFEKWPWKGDTVLMPFLWHDGFCLDCDQYVWHPLKKEWVENFSALVIMISEDIVNWVLQQESNL